jgi:polyribonucleotide nucleotidyltransferase
MGLVFAEGTYTTLTDILGAEDAFGDMDFKVAGTADFVTALQLDTKIDGLPADVLGRALQQAREARLQVLEVMGQAIEAPRDSVRDTAPKIISFEIPLDRIGEVIGPKGKVINLIQQETGADINVDDDGTIGTVTIGAKEGAAVEDARSRIDLIINPPRAEIGEVYTGKVVNITKFGAFVNILPGRDGLLHISKLGKGKRVERVEDVLSLGVEIEVRVDDVDPQGKVALSPVTDLVGGDDGGGARGGGGGGGGRPAPATENGGSGVQADPEGADREYVSFEETFENEARQTFGDLGPQAATPAPRADDSGGPRRNRDRGPRRSGPRR